MRKSLIGAKGTEQTMRDVLGGEYEIPEVDFHPRTILDIGGNIGAFAEWAHYMYPSSKIISYEPFRDNIKAFKANHAGNPQIELVEAAVSNFNGTANLYLSDQSTCCNSLIKGAWKTTDATQETKVIDARDLPLAELVKIDTEGSEPMIIEALLKAQRPRVVIFEFHSPDDRKKCDDILSQNGYDLCYGKVFWVNIGLLGFKLKKGKS